jgi:hypothetical protein
MRKLLLALSLVLAVPAAASAQLRGENIPWDFSAPLIGARAEGAGFVGGGDYATDGLTFGLEWNVTYDQTTNLFSYLYTLTDVGGRAGREFGNGAGISHFIMGLSGSCGANVSTCVDAPTTWFNGEGATSLVPGGVTTYGAGASNPGLSTALFGVKFDHGFEQTGTDGVITIAFESERRPMWGDFYIKGGTSDYLLNTALTTGFTSSDNSLHYVAVPNSLGGTTVPEPATVGLLGAGLVGVAAVAARRRRTR